MTLTKYCEVCGEYLPMNRTRIGNRCLGCENAPVSRWMIGKFYEHRPSGQLTCWTTWNDAHIEIAAMAEDDTGNDYYFATAIIVFITELVHEIERLQGEVVDMQDQIERMAVAGSTEDFLFDQPLHPPYPHDDFSMGYT